MGLFAALMLFWAAVIFGGKVLWRVWRRWRHSCQLKVARSLSEIHSAEYYRRISWLQFAELVLRALEAQKCVLLGDPWLLSARHQGYIWKGGVKVALVDGRAKPLTSERLLTIAQEMNKVKANRVLVFSPFPQAPKDCPPGVDVLYGRQLCSWFSILDMAPPTLGQAVDQCPCGAPAEERVSRTGLPVMSCTRYPDCTLVRPLETIQQVETTLAAASAG